MKMRLTALAVLCALALLTAHGAAAIEPQEVQAPEAPIPRIEGLSWRLPPKFATFDGDLLVIDIPADAHPADAVAEAVLPPALFRGATGFSMSVEAEGSAIAVPERHHLGLKFQFQIRKESTGLEWWPNCAKEPGDFGPKTLRNDIAFGGMGPDGTETVTLQLGLQGTSGRVVFDLSTLCGGPSEGLFRRINQDWVVRYPSCREGEREAPRSRSLRGCMLPGARPTTEDDIATLASWGATLARFQMARKWSTEGGNDGLDEYFRWIDSKLDNLEDILRWARARGMRITVDLHSPPGGRNESRETAMVRDARYADAFVETWRRIAARCAPIVQTACAPDVQTSGVIYGYDLVNEPVQTGRAPFDYWTLQRRAAEAVREIDPVTAIIVESNSWDAPNTFAYLSPLRMDNVIYQVHVYAPMEFTHQGVGKSPVGPKWPDPGKKWTRDYLRDVLAPVREFERRHGARIYVGEFSASVWADGAENYLRDCIALFEEYGWDWTYHAFRESPLWDVDKTCGDGGRIVPAAEETPRKRVLLDGFRR